MKEKIPFKHVHYTVYMKLANKLDPDSPVVGNNWRMLAEKLGYSTEDILAFEYQQTSHGRNTIKILHDYRTRLGSTVNEVIEALKAIERPDALLEVEESLPEIEKSYQEEQERLRQLQQGQEHEYRCNSCEAPPSYSSAGYQHKSRAPISKYHYPNGVPTNSSDVLYLRQRSAPPAQGHAGSSVHQIEHDLAGPDYKRQRSVPITDSMAVRGHNGHSQYFDLEPMDHSPAMHDDPVPAALGIMRGLQRFDRQAGPSMMNSITTEKKLDTVIFRQPYTTGNHLDRHHPNLKLEIPTKADIMRHRVGHEMDNFYSPSPTPTTPNTPLHSLAQMAEGKKYHPDEAYRDLIRMKQQEEMIQGRVNSGHGHMDERGYAIKHEMASDLHVHPSSDGDRLKIKGDSYIPNGTREHANDLTKEAPNTYPLRLKSNSYSSSTSPASSVTQNLMKSASVPNNMKPSEYRKTFRHIKVFVTYSADDKRHTQRVLNLCKCLEKNGFSCCVDIYHRKLQPEDRAVWCQKRFEEADFILVVVSPKYRRDVEACDMDNDADDSDSMDSDDNRHPENPHQLHTKQIYRFMYREYLTKESRGLRFIPLLFQGMTREFIPDWLVNPYTPLVYEWPSQYKDLLWMLTKPEKRIPINQTLTDRSDSHESSNSTDIDIEQE